MSNVPQNPDAPVAIDLSNAGQDPIQTLYDPERLTDVEKEILLQWGWDGKSPVPADLARRMGKQSLVPHSEVTRESFEKHSDLSTAPDDVRNQIEQAVDALPEGFTMPTQDLQIEMPEMVTDAEALEMMKQNPQLMAQFKDMVGNPAPQVDPNKANLFNNAVQQAHAEQNDPGAGLGPVVGEAARQLEQGVGMEEDPLMKRREEETETEQQADEDPNKPLSKEEFEAQVEKIKAQIDAEDKEAYRTAIMSFSPFEKTYKLTGGLEITFREMEHETEQLLLKQELIDRLQGRTQPESFQQLQTMGQYYLVMATVAAVRKPDGTYLFKVPSNQTLVECLSGLPLGDLTDHSKIIAEDTILRRWGAGAERLWYKGAARKVINKLYDDFSILARNLEVLASRPDFMIDQP